MSEGKHVSTTSWMQTIAPFLSLGTSLATLICCALPALLVSLGMGAVVAGLVASMPWIVAISEHKEIVFLIAGIILVIAATLHFKNKNAPCPADPKQAFACKVLRKVSAGILTASFVLFWIGFLFAFLL